LLQCRVAVSCCSVVLQCRVAVSCCSAVLQCVAAFLLVSTFPRTRMLHRRQIRVTNTAQSCHLEITNTHPISHCASVCCSVLQRHESRTQYNQVTNSYTNSHTNAHRCPQSAITAMQATCAIQSRHLQENHELVHTHLQEPEKALFRRCKLRNRYSKSCRKGSRTHTRTHKRRDTGARKGLHWRR